MRADTVIDRKTTKKQPKNYAKEQIIFVAPNFQAGRHDPNRRNYRSHLKRQTREVYFILNGYGNGEDDPEVFATFTPDRAVQIAESLLRFARRAKQRKSKID